MEFEKMATLSIAVRETAVYRHLVRPPETPRTSHHYYIEVIKMGPQI